MMLANFSEINPFSYQIVQKLSDAGKASDENLRVALKRFKEEANQVLYEDVHCKLTNTELEIKRYYASIDSKAIPLKDIKTVYYQQQRTFPGREALYINDNGWSSLGKIWWALDPLRQNFNFGNKYNVVIEVKNEEWRKGFSVVDMNSFGYYLYELLADRATFYEGLPNDPLTLGNPPLFH